MQADSNNNTDANDAIPNVIATNSAIEDNNDGRVRI